VSAAHAAQQGAAADERWRSRLEQRRPLLASLAGRPMLAGGGAPRATVPGRRRSQLSADPLGGELKVAHDLSEADWKIFRELREVALERFCSRVLDELEPFGWTPREAIMSATSPSTDCFRSETKSSRMRSTIRGAPG